MPKSAMKDSSPNSCRDAHATTGKQQKHGNKKYGHPQGHEVA